MEVEKRLEYLKAKTQIKKIGVLHDPTPYAGLQKAAAEKLAPSYGLEIVGIEQYKQDDADLSVQISKMHAAGARAILKIGIGGTTLTAAKNIKQLGLDMIMLTSLEDLAVFRPVAEVLGDIVVDGRRPAGCRHVEIDRTGEDVGVRQAPGIAVPRLMHGIDGERGAMREQCRLAVSIERHQCLPEIAVVLGQLLCPLLMAGLDRLGRGAVSEPRRLSAEARAPGGDFEAGA
jgi:hypothetical protein